MSKTLVINGCSFGECWEPSDNFIKGLGCDRALNISKVAASFQRTVRSTIEFLSQKNNNDYFFIIPITYSHRWELAVGKHDDELDGTWYPMQNKEHVKFEDIDTQVPHKKLQQLLDNYYGCIPNVRTYWDKLFTQLIALCGFFDSRNVKYICFDMCNQFDSTHLNAMKGFEKLKMIHANKNIIDLFSFCGNKFMWDNMSPVEQTKTEKLGHHHNKTQYAHLEKYILSLYSQH
jgi:hypothetical protein